MVGGPVVRALEDRTLELLVPTALLLGKPSKLVALGHSVAIGAILTFGALLTDELRHRYALPRQRLWFSVTAHVVVGMFFKRPPFSRKDCYHSAIYVTLLYNLKTAFCQGGFCF